MTPKSKHPAPKSPQPPSPNEEEDLATVDSDADADGDAVENDDEEAEDPTDASRPDTSINPYEVLGLHRTSQPIDIRKAYRKLALQHHPDKVPSAEKDNAHKTFQRIALAYAVLSDPTRRRRYDVTGSTSDSLFDGDGDGAFDWLSFYRAQFDAEVLKERMTDFAGQYRHSEREREDVLKEFERSKGSMNRLFECVMCSNVLDDEERFRLIIDEAIKDGKVTAWEAYTEEPEANRIKRRKRAEREAKEAKKMQTEMDEKARQKKERQAEKEGRKEKMEDLNEKYAPKNKERREKESISELAAAIAGRQVLRMGKGSVLDQLEAKYAKSKKAKKASGEAKGKKRKADDFVVDDERDELGEGELDDEAFEAAQKAMMDKYASSKDQGNGSKGARAKSSSSKKAKRTKS